MRNDLYVRGSLASAIQVDPHMRITNYLTKTDSQDVSIVLAELDGPHTNRVNNRSVMIYCLQSGQLDVTVEADSYVLHPGDMLAIPPTRWHSMVGSQASCLIVASPAYDPADEQITS